MEHNELFTEQRIIFEAGGFEAMGKWMEQLDNLDVAVAVRNMRPLLMDYYGSIPAKLEPEVSIWEDLAKKLEGAVMEEAVEEVKEQLEVEQARENMIKAIEDTVEEAKRRVLADDESSNQWYHLSMAIRAELQAVGSDDEDFWLPVLEMGKQKGWDKEPKK